LTFNFYERVDLIIQTIIMNEKRVMFSISQLKIITAKHVLKEAGIEAFSIDKLDSAHAGVFGDIELYVDADKADEARKILVDQEII